MVRHALGQPHNLQLLLEHSVHMVVDHGEDASFAVPAVGMGLGRSKASPSEQASWRSQIACELDSELAIPEVVAMVCSGSCPLITSPKTHSTRLDILCVAALQVLDFALLTRADVLRRLLVLVRSRQASGSITIVTPSLFIDRRFHAE